MVVIGKESKSKKTDRALRSSMRGTTKAGAKWSRALSGVEKARWMFTVSTVAVVAYVALPFHLVLQSKTRSALEYICRLVTAYRSIS
jgi:hypothetical protein